MFFMIRYETLILAVPEIATDEVTGLEAGFSKVIKDFNGSLISFERWGKYRLAFPVRGFDYGVYFLARFEVEDEAKGALLDALKIFLAVKHNELVMRFMMTRLAKHASLAYQRPESLEEAPTRDSYKQKYAAESSEHAASEMGA
jgi:ribosomal protein S6